MPEAGAGGQGHGGLETGQSYRNSGGDWGGRRQLRLDLRLRRLAIFLERPGSSATALPLTHPIRLRVTALLVLGVFAAVNIATTVFSLGAYCLTTYGGNPFAGSVP